VAAAASLLGMNFGTGTAEMAVAYVEYCNLDRGTKEITAARLQADFARNEQVPFVDVVATRDAQSRRASVLMLNRDLDAERELVLEWDDVAPTRVLACETLTGTDLKAVNTFDEARRVAPQRLEASSPGTRMTFRLPARSYTVAHLETT
jgi:alpha-L-arabinofuranosidase